MREFFVILLFLLKLISFDKSDIAQENIYDTPLMSVLNSETAFVTEDGQRIYLKDFTYGFDGDNELLASPQRYALVDFDCDGVNEMIVDITPSQTLYILLYENESDVYGYLFSIRSMHDIKEDGSFVSSCGAGAYSYCSIEFTDNSYRIIDKASKDESKNFYMTDGNECTVEAFKAYEKIHNTKNSVEWIEFS